MGHAWFWMLRNPALLLALVAVGAGVSGVLTMGLSLITALFLVIVADITHHLGHRALNRRARQHAARETLAEARELRQRHADHEHHRAA